MRYGKPPDIFSSWGGNPGRAYADAGLIQDLTPYLEKDGWGNSISPAAWSVFQWNGKQFAAPWRQSLVGVWYNRDLFEKAGITEPPKTWAGLLDAVDKLKASGTTAVCLGEGAKWPGMFWFASLLVKVSTPEEIVSANSRTGGAFNSPSFVRAAKLLDELIATEPFQEGALAADYTDAETLIANGKCGMQLMGEWTYDFATSSLPADVTREEYEEFIGWFPFPVVEGGAGDPTAVFGGGDGFVVSKHAPPEAIDFVKYLTSAEAHQALVDSGAVTIPIVKGVKGAYPLPLFAEMEKVIGNAKFTLNYLDQAFSPLLSSAVNDEIAEIFAGVKTGQEAVDALEALAQEYLDKK